jgi:hypothetical protein
LSQNGLSGISFEAFHYSLAQKHIVLILDGFDEMAARMTPQVTNRNFFELARAVQGRSFLLEPTFSTAPIKSLDSHIASGLLYARHHT